MGSESYIVNHFFENVFILVQCSISVEGVELILLEPFSLHCRFKLYIPQSETAACVGERSLTVSRSVVIVVVVALVNIFVSYSHMQPFYQCRT